jgi:glycosyltransferase involved in cell wall biosynthesis
VLRPQKRNDILLNATPAILREIPDLRVAIVGNGPLARELESQAADLGLSDHPRFAFFRFADSFAAYMRALDGFILPSSWEGLPLAVIDALACGTPQVVTAVGGVPEAVTPDTGVLVPPGDSDALALGVVRLLRSSAELDRRRVASIERHRALFTVERMIAGAIATYEAVVDKRLQHCE